jgi:DtxR family Mn-dependent transcriptional regulator
MTEKLKKISLKQQIYLETVYDLSRKEGHTHIKLVAEKLSKRMPSVTEVMRKLAEKNLINYDVRKNLSLTDYGCQVAKELDERHGILADFYCKILGCSFDRAQNIACKVEHVVDADFCSRLAGFASFIRAKEDKGIDLIQEFKDYYEKL